MKKSEMINKLVEHYTGGNKSRFAQILGITPQTIASWLVRETFNAELIYEKLPDVSASWLLSGVGEMLNVSEHLDTRILHNPAITHFATENDADTEVEELPLVPSDLVKQPDIDIYEVVTTNRDIPRQPVVKQFPPATLFYRITSKSMEPYICSGDKLVLDAYPRGHEQIIPGDPYVVDTRPNGFVTRLLYNHPDGYLARTFADSGRYAEFIIPFSDIIRIYRIVGLLRTNVQ